MLKAGVHCNFFLSAVVSPNRNRNRNDKVFVKGMLEEELQGKRFLFRSAADLVAVRGAVDRRPLLQSEDFEALRAKAGAMGSEGGLTVVG